MVNILHITEDHSTHNFGISSAVDALTRCVPEDIQSSVACIGEETLPLRHGVTLYAFPSRGSGKLWRYAAGAHSAIEKAIAAADVVHLHGLWMWMQWFSARKAAYHKKPFVVTPHGMLEPWIWQRQTWLHHLKKFLYWKGVAYPAFRRTSVVHAITAREAENLQYYFPKQTPVIIPHGIDLQVVDEAIAELPPANVVEKPYFLFVGRLHPVKAIHLLIRAFSRLTKNIFILKIAGPSQPREQTYAESLYKLVVDLGLEDRVIFTGVVKGQTKWQLYRDAWAFCLPSYSEVIGLVNLEAAASKTPVITTFESGVVEDWDRFGGLRIHPTEDEILSGLQQAQNWSLAQRLERGQAMRGLIERQYSWKQVGQLWANEYHRLSEGGLHV